MPVYAATRVRSILFYIGLVGNSEDEAYNELASALSDSVIPLYLKRAINEKMITDMLLEESVKKALNALETK